MKHVYSVLIGCILVLPFLQIPANGTPSKASLNYRLFLAVRDDKPKIVEKLLSEGANANATYEGSPMLGHASLLPIVDLNMIELLVQHGAKVNAKDNIGETAIFGVALMGSPEAVSYLIAHGAKVNVADKDGKTPLDMAFGGKVIAIIKAAGGVGKTSDDSSSHTSSWVCVAHFSGETNKQTDAFWSSGGDNCYISWTSSNMHIEGVNDQPGNFLAILKDADTNTDVTMIANVIGAKSDRTDLHNRGRFYLEIGADEPWTIDIYVWQ